MVHVPYRGSAPALNGLVAGNVDLMFDNLGVSLGFVSGGALRLLAVASEARLPALAQVPTLAETLPGFASQTWFAIAAPPKTPPALAARISADCAAALREPDVIKRLTALSAEPVGSDPAATAAFIAAEITRWGEVIKTADIKIE
jgi:tripartite-type tricarboxylate transporter receptor subunit TctC